uniref:Uncharacterized protein n=1 Tax=Fagus sylvatica TaxID=28930 RepID=A0A2N9J5S0_FAGSY
MQDFKSQDWISITLASPRSIFFSQVFGTAMGCFMSPLIFWFFYKVYSVGNPDGSYPAPYGLMYRGIALLGVEGLRPPRQPPRATPVPWTDHCSVLSLCSVSLSPNPCPASRASPSDPIAPITVARQRPILPAPSDPIAPITVAPSHAKGPSSLPAPSLSHAAQLKEITIAFKNSTEAVRSQGPVDTNELYEAVMSTEGFPEEMLASAFDYMVQEEKVGKAFMVKAPRLRKLWLDNYFTKNM